jgi:hypothetical protein
MDNAPQIEGVDEIVKWFGYWPRFHDAEVLSISLDRWTGSRVAIYAFERTSGVDSSGYYVTSKDAVITFTLEGFPVDAEGIVNTRIEYFNNQNVLMNAAIEILPQGYALMLQGVFGVTGQICGERVRVSIEPGRPRPAIPT